MKKCLKLLLVGLLFLITIVNAEEINTTSVEYLAMSELAKCSCDNYIGQKVGVSGVIDNCISNKDNKKFLTHNTLNFTEKVFTNQLLDKISDWKIVNTYRSSSSGLYAVVFENNDEHVVAFRGTEAIVTEWTNLYAYQYLNITSSTLNQSSSLVKNAIDFIDTDIKTVSDKKYSITSFNSGLATLVSNYVGVYGYDFNGAPYVDYYYKKVDQMSKNFKGVDKWKSTDYVNEHCAMGNFELGYKNYVTLEDQNFGYNSNLGAFDNVSCTSWSIIDSSNDSLVLSKKINNKKYGANDQIIKTPLQNKGKLMLGSSGNDKFNGNLYDAVVAYGGSGNDTIIGTVFGDTLVGGPGTDTLDGKEGNDTYIYWKGNGVDTIYDLAGQDSLKLYGFDSNDNIEIVEEDDQIVISNNSEPIIYVNKKRASIYNNYFNIYKYNEDYSGSLLKKIQDGFKWMPDTNSVGIKDNIYKSYVVIGSTSINIYDENDSIVYLLLTSNVTFDENNSKAIYNDYGNFYINKVNDTYVYHISLKDEYSLKATSLDNKKKSFYYVNNKNNTLKINKAVNVSSSENEVFSFINNEGTIELYNGQNELINFTEVDSFYAINSTDSVTIDREGSQLLNVKLEPSITNDAIYTSSDTSVAIVDSNGRITAVEPGECTIEVTNDDGVRKNISVTVENSNSQDNTISQIEYLAMSEFAYCDLNEEDLNSYISDLTTKCKVSNSLMSHYNMKDLPEKQFVNKLLNYIKDWKVINIYDNKTDGFYSVGIEKEGKHVLAIRGSQSLNSIEYIATDWYDNVIYGFFEQASSQMSSLIRAVDQDKAYAENHNKDFTITGHSLGGGLALLASNYVDVKAVGFDSSPTVDVSYIQLVNRMSKNFNGIDSWKAIDYSNERCPVGALDNSYKNYYHLKNRYIDVWNTSNYYRFNLTNPWNIPVSLDVPSLGSDFVNNFFSPHHRWAIVDLKNDNLSLSPVVKEHIFKSGDTFNKYSLFNNKKLYMGSSGNDTLVYTQSHESSDNIMYGGSGNDTIYGSSFTNDILIGGPGNDKLIGKEGNDKYIYWKGHGKDTIVDISGNDTLELYGFSNSGEISITSTDEKQIIKYNGTDIIYINKNRNVLNFLNSFVIKVYDDSYQQIEELKIQDWNTWKKYNSYIIACPTKVQIFDENNNMVLELQNKLDEPIINEYGEFFVNEEDGELIKYVTVREDYNVKIVATDNGHMNFTKVENGETLLITGNDNITLNKNDVFEIVDNGVVELYDNNHEQVELTPNITITANKIISEDNVTLEPEGTYSLNVNLEPSNSNEKITYTSSNTNIAIVNKNGKITAISAGDCIITIAVESGLSKEVTVNVKKTIVIDEPEVNSTTEDPNSNSTTVDPEPNTPTVDPDPTPATNTDPNTNQPSTAPEPEQIVPQVNLAELKQIDASTKTIKLSFNKVDGANGYFVYRKNGKKWKKVATIKNVNSTIYTNKKLKAGTSYTYKVSAYVTSKKKKKTIYTTIFTTDTITATTAPATPKASVKSYSFDSLKVDFKKAKGATKYEIFRSTAKKGAYEKVGESTSTSYIDNGLKTGTTYFYKVRGCNNYCGGFSKVVSRKPDLNKPNVSVYSSEKGKVTITPTTVSGENGYQIQKSTKKKKGFKNVNYLDVNVTSYDEVDLKSGKSFYYRVRAYRIVDGKTIFGPWSSVKKVKVK